MSAIKPSPSFSKASPFTRTCCLDSPQIRHQLSPRLPLAQAAKELMITESPLLNFKRSNLELWTSKSERHLVWSASHIKDGRWLRVRWKLKCTHLAARIFPAWFRTLPKTSCSTHFIMLYSPGSMGRAVVKAKGPMIVVFFGSRLPKIPMPTSCRRAISRMDAA